MIVPSIDLQDGRAVQLRRGRERVLDGGDPFERLEAFAVAGEVAVVDLDAAMGRGSNAVTIKEMVERAPCRVGGGIRSLDSALQWLDHGAVKVVLGTAASPELCGALPREREGPNPRSGRYASRVASSARWMNAGSVVCLAAVLGGGKSSRLRLFPSSRATTSISRSVTSPVMLTTLS